MNLLSMFNDSCQTPPSSPRGTFGSGGAYTPIGQENISPNRESPSKRQRMASPSRGPKPTTPAQRVVASLTLPDSPIHSLRRLGGLTIGEELGSGAFGTVAKAEFNGTPVAVKLIPVCRLDEGEAVKKQLENSGCQSMPTTTGDALATLSAMKDTQAVQGVVPVLGAKVDVATDKYAWLTVAMALGVPFAQVLRSAQNKEVWFQKYLETIREVHSQLGEGKFFRDLKPENAIVRDGKVELCDHSIGKGPKLSNQYWTGSNTSKDHKLAKALWMQYQEYVEGRSLETDEDKKILREEACALSDGELEPFWPRHRS